MKILKTSDWLREMQNNLDLIIISHEVFNFFSTIQENFVIVVRETLVLNQTVRKHRRVHCCT